MPPTPESVVRSWFDEVWNQGREEAIDRLMGPNALAHDLPSPDGLPLRGPAAFKPFFRKFRDGFPDLRIEVARTVTENDTVTAHCLVTGTHTGNSFGPPTGRPVQFKGICIARVENGQIVEAWNEFNFLLFYQQLGVLPQLPA
jgi:predicted ester cyclase